MKIHENSLFWVIERTQTVRIVTSDCRETRFGNDARFLTRCGQKCSTGHRTGFSMGKSLQKVFPRGCHKRVFIDVSLIMSDW